MKIAIGSDKSGFALKEAIKSYLLSEDGAAFLRGANAEANCKDDMCAKVEANCGEFEIQVDDLGTADLNEVHPYYRVAKDVAPLVQNGTYARAILICGTGAGMSVVANKFKGVQAVACENVYSAKMARAINGAQVLCMGGWIVAPEMGLEMAKAFLSTDYLQDLEDWRKIWLTNAAAKVAELEEDNFKD